MIEPSLSDHQTELQKCISDPYYFFITYCRYVDPVSNKIMKFDQKFHTREQYESAKNDSNFLTLPFRRKS